MLYFFFHDRQLQDKFVALLRLLLLWDPKARGGSVLQSGKKECFDVLEKIINTVVIVTDLQLLLSCFVRLNVYSKVLYTTYLLHIL